MAWARTFQALVGLCATSPAPFLSRGAGHHLGLSGRPKRVGGVVMQSHCPWTVSENGPCLCSLARVVEVFPLLLVRAGSSSLSTTLGDMWLVPITLLTSWVIPWPSGESSMMSTTSLSLSSLEFGLRVPSAMFVLALASLGLYKLFPCVIQ
jgi:hypothetical protein